MGAGKALSSLVDCRRANNIGKSMTARFVIMAKDAQAYIVPAHVHTECNPVVKDVEEGPCRGCKHGAGSKEYDIIVADNYEAIVSMCHMNRKDLLGALRYALHIKQKCPCEVNIITWQNAEFCVVCPELISREGKLPESCETAAYHFGEGLHSNRCYQGDVRPVAHPGAPGRAGSSVLVNVLENVKEIKSTVEEFELTTKDRKLLKVFQCLDTTKSVLDKLKAVAHSLSALSGIVGRDDMHMVFDLTYNSVLEYNLGREYVSRGWLETLIVGDRTEGKSKTMKAFLNFIGLGDYCSGQRASPVGLVAGISFVNKIPTVKWGLLPMNAGGLVIVDECHELKPEVCGALRDARSEGSAKIDKAGCHEMADTRTRLILISNPKKANLAMYNYGCMSLIDVFPVVPDQRRVDLMLVVARGEVPEAVKNNIKLRPLKPCASQEAFRVRTLWAWSRRKNNVKILESAEKLLRGKYPDDFGKLYIDTLPLGDDMRNKLGRLSCAVAACVCSMDTKDQLIVRDCHVHAAASILHGLYCQKSMGFDRYSRRIRTASLLTSDAFATQLIGGIAEAHRKSFVNSLYRADEITAEDVHNWLGVDDAENARQFIRAAVHINALKREGRGYHKTADFIKFLDAWLEQNGDTDDEDDKAKGHSPAEVQQDSEAVC